MLNKGAQSSGNVAERSRNSRDGYQRFRQQGLKLCGGARKDYTFILLVASFSMDVQTLVHSAPTSHMQLLSTVPVWMEACTCEHIQTAQLSITAGSHCH